VRQRRDLRYMCPVGGPEAAGSYDSSWVEQHESQQAVRVIKHAVIAACMADDAGVITRLIRGYGVARGDGRWWRCIHLLRTAGGIWWTFRSVACAGTPQVVCRCAACAPLAVFTCHATGLIEPEAWWWACGEHVPAAVHPAATAAHAAFLCGIPHLRVHAPCTKGSIMGPGGGGWACILAPTSLSTHC
jgi:hypothetical protein